MSIDQAAVIPIIRRAGQQRDGGVSAARDLLVVRDAAFLINRSVIAAENRAAD
jgi:hypothetical protein